MRTIIFIALGALVAFLAGLAGTYVVMPMVAPELVEAERMRADSLALADSLSLADSLALGADSLAAVALPDSLAALGASAAGDSLLSDAAPPAALRDSLEALQRRVEAYQAQIRAYEAQLEERAAQRAQASDLAGTLVKLEDRELSGVLRNLDLDILELLYQESSARNRARLLGALPPARTVAFIRRATSTERGSERTAEPETAAPDEPDASTPR